MLKDTSARQLRDRLRGVLQGEAALSGVVTAKVLEEFNRQRIDGTSLEASVQVAVYAVRAGLAD
jgi:hypothetical protein